MYCLLVDIVELSTLLKYVNKVATNYNLLQAKLSVPSTNSTEKRPNSLTYYGSYMELFTRFPEKCQDTVKI